MDRDTGKQKQTQRQRDRETEIQKYRDIERQVEKKICGTGSTNLY